MINAMWHTKLFAADCGTDTYFDIDCSSGGGITGLLVTIVNWLAVGVAIAVLGGIIYGAVLYTTAAGDAGQAKRALGIIRNSFVALTMYFAMWALLNWLVPGGLFTP
jgi:hypothetical protein